MKCLSLLSKKQSWQLFATSPVKGHGGGKSSVMRLSSAVQTGEYPWVCRTDIRGYYGAIDKARLLSQLKQHITHPVYLSLLEQYLYYSTEDGGEFHTPEKGIARGCALSPLMGALHLWVVDDYFSRQKNIRYARYMDDFVILAKNRWSLRRQVKALNRRLSDFGFVKHPDKTFIGRVLRGFDWLGAWLTDRGVTGVAPRALKNYYEKVRRLYERTRHWPGKQRIRRVSEYQHRWKRWAAMGVMAMTTFAVPSAPSVSAVAVLPAVVTVGTRTTVPVDVSESRYYNKTFTQQITGSERCTLGVQWNTSASATSCLPRSRFATSKRGLRGLSVAPGVTLGVAGSQSFTGEYATCFSCLVYHKQYRNTFGEGAWSGMTPNDFTSNAEYPWSSGTLSGQNAMLRPSTTFYNNLSGNVILDVDDDAAPGTYVIPDLYSTTPFMNGPQLVSGRTITVRGLASCSITPPSIINFGQVTTNAKRAGEVLAVKNANFVITCGTGVYQLEYPTVRVTGDTGSTKYALKMDTPGGGAVGGEIMGMYRGPMTDSVGDCSTGAGSSATALDFSATTGGVSVASRDTFKQGTNNVPYKFTLCSLGNGDLGPATAQATLVISW